MLHLTARISPSSYRILGQMMDVLIDAVLLLSIQKRFDLLTQRDDLEHQKPFDLAALESFKQELAGHEAITRRRMKRSALSSWRIGGLWGFSTVVTTTLPFIASTPIVTGAGTTIVLGAGTVYLCYNAFKKTLSLTEK